MSWADPADHETTVRARLGAAMRRFGHAVVGRHGDVGTLEAAAAYLEAAADEIEPMAMRSRPLTSFGAGSPEVTTTIIDGEPMLIFGDRPFSGPNSPWGLEYAPRRHGDNGVITDVTLHAAHEGAPGRSHGGVVAGFFDDLTGYVLRVLHETAFTGELSIRYEAAVPLHVPLTARAWVEERSGRKIHMRAELLDGERVLATCRALYITVNAVAP